MKVEYKNYTIGYYEESDEWKCVSLDVVGASLKVVKRKIDKILRNELKDKKLKVIINRWGSSCEYVLITSFTDCGTYARVIDADGDRSKEMISHMFEYNDKNVALIDKAENIKKEVDELNNKVEGIYREMDKFNRKKE